MGKADDGPRAFSDRKPLQIGNAVFGDNIHLIRPRGGNDIARCQVQNNAAFPHPLTLIGGRKAHEGLAALGRIGAAHELGLAARGANVDIFGLACDSPGKVQAFHDAAVAHDGSSIEDPQGRREGGAVRLYLSYVRDPAGNKLCALHRGG